MHREASLHLPGLIWLDTYGSLLCKCILNLKTGQYINNLALANQGLVRLYAVLMLKRALQVCTFAFRDGQVFFRNRFVRSEAFLREQQAQKMLYRGAFSVGNPSGGFFFNPFDFSVKGIANTSILYWGGKLLALYEVMSCSSSAGHAICSCIHRTESLLVNDGVVIPISDPFRSLL